MGYFEVRAKHLKIYNDVLVVRTRKHFLPLCRNRCEVCVLPSQRFLHVLFYIFSLICPHPIPKNGWENACFFKKRVGGYVFEKTK